MKTTTIHINEFTLEEYRIIREILIEWNYEWLEYDIIHESPDENVKLSFYLDESVISIGEFIHLMFCVGHESTFRK